VFNLKNIKMKKILLNVLAISSVTLLMLSSCKKNDVLVTSNGGKAGTLTANVTTLPLNKALVNDTTTVIRFSFQAANFGYNAAVTNTLQIDADGDNWAHPTLVGLNSRTYSQGYSTMAFNAILLKLNLPAGVASKVNVRVANAISTASTVPVAYTNVLSLTVTPFNLTTWIWVPGDYEGWANNANTAGAPHMDSLVSVTGNGIYTGIIDFRGYAGSTGTLQYKLIPVKGSWNDSWGTFDKGTTNTTIVYDGANDGNLWVPTAKPYLITVNTNTNTITAVACDWYSLLGDAIPGSNWSVDTELKYINDGNNVWSVTGLAMTVDLPPNDGFKMRQDDSWNDSWGTASAAGMLTNASGVNIGIATAGNYNFSVTIPPSAFGSNTTNPLLLPYTLTKQ
jgi:hypothetical protein